MSTGMATTSSSGSGAGGAGTNGRSSEIATIDLTEGAAGSDGNAADKKSSGTSNNMDGVHDSVNINNSTGVNDNLDHSIPVASWPAATPSEHAKNIFSIVCGNSHYHWAIHEGMDLMFVPHIFWNTAPLTVADLESIEDPCKELIQHLPDQACTILFGEPRQRDVLDSGLQASATKQRAIETSVSRRMPVISVYVVSTNPNHERGLKFLFSQVPCRLYKLQASDFWSADQGCYPKMGVDRVAALRGAKSKFGLPALVIDGGTATTYTATDAAGMIIGNGISPGLFARIDALHRDSGGAIKKSTPADVQKRVSKHLDKKEPFNRFTVDRKDLTLATILTDMAYLNRSVVQWWLQTLGPAKNSEPPSEETPTDGNNTTAKLEVPIVTAATPTENISRSIVVTGGDLEVLGQVLEDKNGESHSGLVEPDPFAETPQEGDYKVERFRGIIHYGVANVLVERVLQFKEQRQDPEQEQLRIQMLGLRVAKRFPHPGPDGDKCHRGSIVSINRGKTVDEDWFLVQYDHAPDAYLNLIQAYEALKLYLEVGEKNVKKGPINAAQRVSREEKKGEVQRAVDSMVQQSTKLQNHVNTAPPPKTKGRASVSKTPSKKDTAATKSKETETPVAKKGPESTTVTQDVDNADQALLDNAKVGSAAPEGEPTADATTAKDSNGDQPLSKVDATKTAVVTQTQPTSQDAKATTTEQAATDVDVAPEPTQTADNGPQVSAKTTPASTKDRRSELQAPAPDSGLTQAQDKKKRRSSTTDKAEAASKESQPDLASPTPASSRKRKVSSTKAAASKESYVGRRVAKFFVLEDSPSELYFGTVMKLNEGKGPEDDLWEVLYDDGDAEEYDVNDMREALALYEISKSKDKKQAKKARG